MPTKTKAKKLTLDGARELLRRMEQLQDEAEALMVEHGISEKLAEAADLKRRVTEWAVENEVEAISVEEGDRYYGLRRDTYNKRVVGDDEELAEVKDPTAVIPLKTIIKAKYKKGWAEVWKSITTRRVDMTKLEMAVKEGKLTVDEITPAYYHDTKAPYLRPYGKK